MVLVLPASCDSALVIGVSAEATICREFMLRLGIFVKLNKRTERHRNRDRDTGRRENGNSQMTTRAGPMKCTVYIYNIL